MQQPANCAVVLVAYTIFTFNTNMSSSLMPETSPVILPGQPKGKIYYIDNLKIVLTALVVIHHALVTYGAPGGWYYSEKTTLEAAKIPMTMLVAINQAFFMGFFFFLSALFVEPSYNRKGTGKFTYDRLLRLGVPLAFYSFILSPFMNYLVYYFAEGRHITFFQFLGGYDSWINFGVMWFVAALLLFNFIYLLYRQMFREVKPSAYKVPSNGTILLFALGLGIVSFLVRVIFPIGWVLNPVGFQLGHFPQYIAAFVLGIVAWRSKWTETISYAQGRSMKRMALLIVFLGLPLIFSLKIIFDAPIEWFSGGPHWPSAAYSVWEQLTGFAIITALIGIGRHKWNGDSVFLSRLSRYSFAVYVFHPLVLIVLALLLKSWAVDPALKLLIVAPAGVVLSFILASVLVKIPGLKHML